jgi:hypothetical protein
VVAIETPPVGAVTIGVFVAVLSRVQRRAELTAVRVAKL